MRTIAESATIVGRIHGTAFHFSGEQASAFLDYIATRYTKIFDDYYGGFLDGIAGKYVGQYGYLCDSTTPEEFE